jgi:hypothetical protein
MDPMMVREAVGEDPTMVEAARCRGAHRGGASVWRELDGGRLFTSVDPVMVGEAAGEDLTTVEAIEEQAGAWVVAK